MKLKDAYIFDMHNKYSWTIYRAWHLEGSVYQCHRYSFSVSPDGIVQAGYRGICVLDATKHDLIDRKTAVASCEAMVALACPDAADYGFAAERTFNQVQS